jgi:hypothetical protein
VFVYDSVVINNRDAIRLMKLIRVYLHLDCTLRYMHRVSKYNDTKLYIYYWFGLKHDRGPIWLPVSGSDPAFRILSLMIFNTWNFHSFVIKYYEAVVFKISKAKDKFKFIFKSTIWTETKTDILLWFPWKPQFLLYHFSVMYTRGRQFLLSRAVVGLRSIDAMLCSKRLATVI